MLLTYISSISLPTRDVGNENSAFPFAGVTAKIWAIGSCLPLQTLVSRSKE
jgi:hypothetical protein